MVGCWFPGAEVDAGKFTDQVTGWARLWLSESTPGIRIGFVSSAASSVGFSDRRDDGKAREEMCVAAARYRSLIG